MKNWVVLNFNYSETTELIECFNLICLKLLQRCIYSISE